MEVDIFRVDKKAYHQTLSFGYLQEEPSILFCINDVQLGSEVSLQDPNELYKRKYEAIKKSRLSNEIDRVERARGVRMPHFVLAPWLVTHLSSDGDVGITLDKKAISTYDLLVPITAIARI